MFVLISSILMILPAIMQIHLKKMPQILMLIFGSLTLLSFIIKNKIFTLSLFYTILGGIIFLNIEQLIFLIIDRMNINISFGNCAGCSDSYGGLLLGNIIGIIIAPLIIVFYHRIDKKITSFKFYFSLIYMITISTIFLVYEIL